MHMQLFFFNLVHVVLAAEQPFGTAAGTFRIAVDVLGDAMSWATKSFGISEQCPYVDDPIASLNELLPASISGQDQGIDMIVDVFSSWEFSRKAGYNQPLVLAVTGPTGVGKSETGFIIANAILATKSRIGTSRRMLPEGYLVLGGQDYSNTSDAFMGGLSEVHRRINVRITNHLRKCGGGGVIVFDEIQKVVPGALDILLSGLKERGEFRVHSGDSNVLGQSQVEVFPTDNVVFILTSDIGASEMETLLLAYEDRDLIPQQILRAEVKKALDKQWERLHFGSVVSEVIPFMPLEQLQIEQIMTLKLTTMAMEYRQMYWLDLVIDESVVQAMSRPPFVQYRSRKLTATLANGSTILREKTMAKYGARGVETGGPVQDLKTMMFKHMQPWRKGSVLYVTVKGFDATKQTRQFPEIVMYWCAVDISMTPLPAQAHARAQSQVSHPKGSSSSSSHGSGDFSGSDIRRFRANKRVGHYVVQDRHINSPLCVVGWRETLNKDHAADLPND